MNKILLFLSAVIIGLTSSCTNKKLNLKFRENGEFKIVQFTDLHIDPDKESSKSVITFLRNTITKEAPDLVVFTGDVVTTAKYKVGWDMVLSPVEELKTPFAVVFGNHDDENGFDREALAKYIKTYSYSLLVPRVRKVKGYGNYFVPIKDSDNNKKCAGLWFFDSNSYSTIKDLKGYGWFDISQIEWYKKQSEKNTDDNDDKPLPSLAFFHIPLPEYKLAYNDTIYKPIGRREEEECAPQINSGMFAQMLISGDVMATFCGHDHVNDYLANYKNIALCYGRATGGKNTYGDDSSGARIITLFAGKRKFETYYIKDSSDVQFDKVTLPKGWEKINNKQQKS